MGAQGGCCQGMGATGDVPSPALGPPSPSMSPAPALQPQFGASGQDPDPKHQIPAVTRRKLSTSRAAPSTQRTPGTATPGPQAALPVPPRVLGSFPGASQSKFVPRLPGCGVRLTSFLSSIAMGTRHNHPYIRGAGASPPAAPSATTGTARGAGTQGRGGDRGFVTA